MPKSARRAAWRNMMVGAVNAGIAQGVFTLADDDDRWEGKEARYAFTLPGDIPVTATVRRAGWGELRIYAAAWPDPDGGRWLGVACAGMRAGAAVAAGWVERRNGAWLQTPPALACDFRCRTEVKAALAAATVAPEGFQDHGRFIL